MLYYFLKLDFIDVAIYIFLFFLVLIIFILSRNLNFLFLIYSYLLISIFSILLYEQGYFDFLNVNYRIFFEGDAYADLLKVAFSYGHVFATNDYLDLKIPEYLYVNNPYNYIMDGVMYGYHATPLYVLITHAIAFTFKVFGFEVNIFVYMVYSLLLIGLFIFLKNSIKAIKPLHFFVYMVFSYPFIFMLQRGNVYAIILPIFLYVLFKKFCNDKEFNTIDILLLVFAGSVRPNYLIFLILFINPYKFKSSLINLFKIISIFFVSNSIFLYVASMIYPGYSFNSFLLGLNRYSLSHIVGDGFDSSTFKTIINLLDFEFANSDFLIPNYNQLIKVQFIITFLYLIIAFLEFVLFSKGLITKVEYLFSLAAISLVATSPIGDYHLLIFIILQILLIDIKTEQRSRYFLLVLILFLIKPKSISLEFLNFSLIINNIILNIFVLSPFLTYVKKLREKSNV
jgi:hypothetical protein